MRYASIGAESKPIDLVYEELMQSLMTMERDPRYSERDTLEAINEVTDYVIEMMGKTLRFNAVTERIVNRNNCMLYRSIFLEALERSQSMSEVNYQADIDSSSAPRPQSIVIAASMISRAISYTLYRGMLEFSDSNGNSQAAKTFKELTETTKLDSLDVTLASIIRVSSDIQFKDSIRAAISNSAPIVYKDRFLAPGGCQRSYLTLKANLDSLTANCNSDSGKKDVWKMCG